MTIDDKIPPVTNAPVAGSDQSVPTQEAAKPSRLTRARLILLRSWRWIGAISLMMVTALTLSLLLDSTARQQIVTKILGPEQTEEAGVASSRELTSAMGQHFFIALPISKCFPDSDVSKTNVSSTVFATFMLGLQPLGNHAWSSRGDFPNGDPEPSIKLTNYQMSVLVLSDAITRARMRFADNATTNKSRMEFYQWILIILGALTTILISLKSILNERTPGFVAVGVFAVIFSA
jgi:hypothetical protein